MMLLAGLVGLSLGQAAALPPERLRECDVTIGAVSALARRDGQDDTAWDEIAVQLLTLRLDALAVGGRPASQTDIMRVSARRADDAYLRVRQVLAAGPPEDQALRRQALEAVARSCAAEIGATPPA